MSRASCTAAGCVSSYAFTKTSLGTSPRHSKSLYSHNAPQISSRVASAGGCRLMRLPDKYPSSSYRCVLHAYASWTAKCTVFKLAIAIAPAHIGQGSIVVYNSRSCVSASFGSCTRALSSACEICVPPMKPLISWFSQMRLRPRAMIWSPRTITAPFGSEPCRYAVHASSSAACHGLARLSQ